jgi:hypothetical protein
VTFFAGAGVAAAWPVFAGIAAGYLLNLTYEQYISSKVKALAIEQYEAHSLHQSLDLSSVTDVNGSSRSSETLSGPSYRNTFSFDVSAITGKDAIRNFQKVDVLATSKALPDKDKDGIVTFGKGGLLDFDGSGKQKDTVLIKGVDGTKGLRLLGKDWDDSFVYATASVRPAGAKESKIGNDLLSGDKADKKENIFFFDTALDLFLGDDVISNFGRKDLLVTTTKLSDPNRDNRINFDISNKLALSGGVAGPGDPGMPGEGGLVSMTQTKGKALSALEYDGAVSRGGVKYYVYSIVGTRATDEGDLFL